MEQNTQNKILEPDVRILMEQVLEQTAKMTKVEDPVDLNGHHQLNGKVSFDIEAKIDPNWVDNKNHNSPYGSAWDYESAQITYYDDKNKVLANVTTTGGFVETREPENHIGKIGSYKTVNPGTQIIFATPNYQKNVDGINKNTSLWYKIGEKDTLVTVRHTDKEDPKQVIRDFYYTINPQQKEVYIPQEKAVQEKAPKPDERQMFERMMEQIETVATKDNQGPRDLNGNYQLNDKVSVALNAEIDPNWVKNNNHNSPYGRAWDYRKAEGAVYSKNKKLFEFRTLDGFVETLEPENHIGKISTVKRVNPNTQFELFTPGYQKDAEGMKVDTINVKNSNGRSRRMTFFHAANEDYNKVLRDAYYTLNPQEKEKTTMNDLITRAKAKLDNMAALIHNHTADQSTEMTAQNPTIDDGRTL